MEFMRSAFNRLKKRNKPRLLLARYERPGRPKQPHFALVVASKSETEAMMAGKVAGQIPGAKFKVKRYLSTTTGAFRESWQVGVVEVPDLELDTGIHLCAVIGKVRSIDELRNAIPRVYFYQIDFNRSGFDSYIWCYSVAKYLSRTNMIDCPSWRKVKKCIREMVGSPLSAANSSLSFVSMLDLMTERSVSKNKPEHIKLITTTHCTASSDRIRGGSSQPNNQTTLE
ncbi:hypothetical protein N7540_008774 [Penicillium herquei]|nr:hypothetical protein N7540_008774 [Penicillium herquei]